MSNFARRVPLLQRLEAVLESGQPHWWRDLLALWRPAGSPSGGLGLRLAIRNGTMNFYRLGQSVAKVGFTRGGSPILVVHVAYVTGLRGTGSHYARLSARPLDCPGYAGDLGNYEGAATLRKWVKEAGRRSLPEKVFVDGVVAANEDIIDLEMGLPAYIRPDDGRQVAPRMDVVALERTRAGPQIAFWEAKLMLNPELRRRGAEPPRVARQLQDYEDWMRNGQEARVALAYRDNCRLLVRLHVMARSVSHEIADLGQLIRHTAASDPPRLDPKPRLLISDPKAWSGWTENHAAKLEGYTVQIARGEPPSSLILKQPSPA